MIKPLMYAALGAAVFATGVAGAAIVTVTVEAPDVQTAQTGTSGATGVAVQNFDGFAVGAFGTPGSTLDWTGVGSYSGGETDPVGRTTEVKAASAFGGAGGSGNYLFVDEFAPTPVFLDLDNLVTYFGFWWSAGNTSNEITLYDGATNLFSFDTTDVNAFLATLPNEADYLGNPNFGDPRPNPSEYYAFLNFFSDTPFDRVEFGGLNFESDNHTIATSFDDITGDPIPTPLPGSAWLLIGGLGALRFVLRARNR